MGWYGYEKYEDRRSTYGNEKEAKKRAVFLKPLIIEKQVQDSIEFNAFIEKGFRYGAHGVHQTKKFNEKDDYPYQVSLTLMDTLRSATFRITNSNEFDSIYRHSILLEKPVLNDTVCIDIAQYQREMKKYVVVNKIKVW
ncbi:hypothetical protein WIW50_07820 [Flavobacteriaceae bacterium 3-367]